MNKFSTQRSTDFLREQSNRKMHNKLEQKTHKNLSANVK